MNTGACPYCDRLMGFFLLPDCDLPVFHIVKCEQCGEDVWYKFSRVDPQAWTVAAFHEQFEVDDEAMTITPRG